MNLRDYIGRRCLLSETSSWSRNISNVSEYRILEISPSGNWVKLMNLNGNRYWKSITDLTFVELLVDLNAEREKETGEGK